jgi:excisionase family DNA binding protein
VSHTIAQSEKPLARTLRNAALALGVCRDLFYLMEKRGEIQLVRVGGRTLVPESELDRLLAAGKPPNPQKTAQVLRAAAARLERRASALEA